MKYRLKFSSSAALNINVSSVNQSQLRDMQNINDPEELFYYAQDSDGEIFDKIGIPVDNFIISVFEVDDNVEIGNAICVLKTGDLQLIDEKINANPGEIIIGSVTNGRGVCGHIDIQMKDFDVSKIKLIQTDLSDFGAESLCFKIAFSLDNGAIEKYSLKHDLYLDITPKVELAWVDVCAEKSLFDEYGDSEGWDTDAVEAVLADKEIIL